MGQRRFEATRCSGCGLHEELCACAERPRLRLATQIVVVQNNKERNKPTNTGRMIAQVLEGAELIRYGERGVAFDDGPLTRPGRDYLLIFPRVEDPSGCDPRPAPVLEPARLAAAASTLVLLDGTWAQCARMSRRVPALAAMEGYALPPGPASHWGVRTASEPGRISPFEAAIRLIELAEGPGPALAMQTYFDRVAAAMLFMKAKLRSPAVPAAWIAEREARFTAAAKVDP